MIGTIVMWSALYLATGAMIGQFHLLRCWTCAAKFSEWGQHARYIAASAMVGLPMTVWGFLDYWFGPCEE